MTATIVAAALVVVGLVGGFFAETISWRWIFWVNLPVVVCVALIVLAAAVQPSRDGRDAVRREPRNVLRQCIKSRDLECRI